MKLICKCSLLKSDGRRLHGGVPSTRMCIECDMYISEDLTHIVFAV